MENTTKISDLPENVASQFSTGNNYIPINIHPNPYGNGNGGGESGNPPPFFDKTVFSNPSLSSSTNNTHQQQEHHRLPSRDIRIDESVFTQDKEITANYIPPTPKNMKDYLSEYELEETRIARHKKQKKRVHFADEWFNKLQLPLLVGCLFLVFQHSIINKFMTKISDLSKIVVHIPFFKEDGNVNLNGMIFKSLLFGSLYFAITLISDFYGWEGDY
jgi:hypothetical protein